MVTVSFSMVSLLIGFGLGAMVGAIFGLSIELRETKKECSEKELADAFYKGWEAGHKFGLYQAEEEE